MTPNQLILMLNHLKINFLDISKLGLRKWLERSSLTRPPIHTVLQTGKTKRPPVMFQTNNQLSSLRAKNNGAHTRGAMLSTYSGLLLLTSAATLATVECDKRQQKNPSQGRYVIIHIWQPPSGAALSGEPGHTSLSICENGQQQEYLSFWPSNGGKNADGSAGTFLTLAEDIHNEGRKPDVDIVLYGLDVDEIKKHYHSLQAHKMQWVIKRDLPKDTHVEYKQNCATVIWKTLLAGGIKNYYHPHKTGPKDSTLRNELKCNHGIWGGIFDGAGWRNWASTPMFILHLTASAKEQELNRFPQTKSWGGGLDYSALENSVTPQATNIEQGKASLKLTQKLASINPEQKAKITAGIKKKFA